VIGEYAGEHCVPQLVGNENESIRPALIKYASPVPIPGFVAEESCIRDETNQKRTL
jgi:hypothetical protein